MKQLFNACLALATMGLVACQGTIEAPPDVPVDPTEEVIPPSRDPVGGAELAPGRALRRMTAAQFNRSLTVATGQEWEDFDRYASALGAADFAEVTEEGTEFNVTFEKLVEDAARETCRAAVAADIAREVGEENVILRHASVESREEAEYVSNLSYLFMRFLGQPVLAGDSRMTPWLGLLNAPPEPETDLDDTTLRARWTAVCVGLVTHPDFVAY